MGSGGFCLCRPVRVSPKMFGYAAVSCLDGSARFVYTLVYMVAVFQYTHHLVFFMVLCRSTKAIRIQVDVCKFSKGARSLCN